MRHACARACARACERAPCYAPNQHVKDIGHGAIDGHVSATSPGDDHRYQKVRIGYACSEECQAHHGIRDSERAANLPITPQRNGTTAYTLSVAIVVR